MLIAIRMLVILVGILAPTILFVALYFDQPNLFRYFGTYCLEHPSTMCGLSLADFIETLEISKKSKHRNKDFIISVNNSEGIEEHAFSGFSDSASKPLRYPLTTYWTPIVSISTLSKLKTCLSQSPSSRFTIFSRIIDPFHPPLDLSGRSDQRSSSVSNKNTKKRIRPLSASSKQHAKDTMHEVKPYQIPFPPWTIIERWRSYEPFPSSCMDFQWGFSPAIYLQVVELLSYFIWITAKMDLTWFAEAGSVIGSVRHWDIIPWDDDLDIRMSEEDWEQLYTYISKGGVPELQVSGPSAFAASKGKIWLTKSTISEAAFRPWKFPFLDIWTNEKISRSQILDSNSSSGPDEAAYQLTDSPYAQLESDLIFPLHYRPFGPFWIPVAHRPFELLRRKDFPTVPRTEIPPVIDECLSRGYDHQKEVWRVLRHRRACLSLASHIPLVTRRYSRASCPFRQLSVLSSFLRPFTKQKAAPRLFDCLKIPKHPDTIAIIQDPSDIAKEIPLDSDGRTPALPEWWKEWTINMSLLSDIDFNSKGESTIATYWPLLFVWECPRPQQLDDFSSEGIIEVLSIGGIPVGVVEICHGDYSLIPKDPIAAEMGVSE